MKKLMLVILFVCFLLVSSLVFAGPFRDVTVSITDHLGNQVEDANVSMYVLENNYFDYSNLTDSGGVVVFDVDARVWVKVKNNLPLIRGVGPGVVPVKDSVRVVNSDNIIVQNSNDVHSSDSDRSSRWTLYRYRTFFFDITPTESSIDFIPITLNNTFKLDQNVYLDFVVSDGTPIINIPTISINELDNHFIVLDLEDYIIDYDDDFDDLTIELNDVSWSGVDGSISLQNGELVVDFFPDFDLIYHQDNELSFTISVDDGEHFVEQNLVWDYHADYRALKGTVIRMYNETPITDYDLFIENDINMVWQDENEFIAFFPEFSNALINITADDYYLSAREIRLTELEGDVELDFTIAPVQFDVQLQDDRHELAFDTTFRWGPGTGRYYNPPTIVICDAPYYENYNPTQAEINKALTVVGFLEEFTDGFYVPVQGENLLIVTNVDECAYWYTHVNTLSILWDPTLLGAGVNGLVPYANYTIMASHAIINNNMNLNIYVQEILQATGSNTDNGYFNPSAFCDTTCAIPSEPTLIDYTWGQRQHSRQPKNHQNDIDDIFINPFGEEFVGKNVYYEIREFSDVFIGGEKRMGSRLLGYLKQGQEIENTNELLKSFPQGAVIIESPMMRDGVVDIVSKKYKELDNSKLNKIKKLFN